MCAWLVLVLVGCVTVHKRWDDVRAADTVDAYRSFLLMYPEHSEYSPHAVARVDDLRWAEAQRADLVLEYQRYLAREPGGQHHERALRRMDELDYDTAMAEGTTAALETYLTRHRSGSRAPEVQVALDGLRFSASARADTPDAYGEYLVHSPDGAHGESARMSRETRAWENAEAHGSLDAYLSFLDTFPEGPHSADARERLAAIRFRTVRVVVNLRESWRSDADAAASLRGLRLVVDFTLIRMLRAAGYRVIVEQADLREQEVPPAREAHPPEPGVGLLVLDYWERPRSQSWSEARATNIEAQLALYSPALEPPIFGQALRTATNISDANASEAAMHKNAQERLGFGLIRGNLPLERYRAR
ncbi:MAG: hypothetical protein ACI8PZ_003029 [Myxococcota bacterium]